MNKISLSSKKTNKQKNQNGCILTYLGIKIPWHLGFALTYFRQREEAMKQASKWQLLLHLSDGYTVVHYIRLFFLINLFIFGCTGSLLLHGLSLVVVSGLFFVVASLVVEQGLSSTGLAALKHVRSAIPCLLHWEPLSLWLSHQGSPSTVFNVWKFFIINNF